MTVDTLRLSARDANELLARGEASADELHAAYLSRDDDVPRPSLSRGEALANAPDPEDGFFGVPAV